MRNILLLISCLAAVQALSLEEIDLDVEQSSVRITEDDISRWADDSIPSGPADTSFKGSSVLSIKGPVPATYSTLGGGQKLNVDAGRAGDSIMHNTLLGQRYFALSSVSIPDEQTNSPFADISKLDVEYGYPVQLTVNVPIINHLDIMSYMIIGTDTLTPSENEYPVKWEYNYKKFGLSVIGYLPEINRLRPFLKYGIAYGMVDVVYSFAGNSQEIADGDDTAHNLVIGSEVDVNPKLNVVTSIIMNNLLEESFRMYSLNMNYWIAPKISVNFGADYNDEVQRWTGLFGTQINF